MTTEINISVKVCKAIAYKIFRKESKKYRNVLHKYSFDH